MFPLTWEATKKDPRLVRLLCKLHFHLTFFICFSINRGLVGTVLVSGAGRAESQLHTQTEAPVTTVICMRSSDRATAHRLTGGSSQVRFCWQCNPMSQTTSCHVLWLQHILDVQSGNHQEVKKANDSWFLWFLYARRQKSLVIFSEPAMVVYFVVYFLNFLF